MTASLSSDRGSSNDVVVDDDDAAGRAHDLFITETMAELSARQGRIADAVAIYRRLLAGGARDDRRARWEQRLAALEGESPSPAGRPAGSRAEPAPAPVPAVVLASAAVPSPPPSPLALPLIVDRPVRSGQIVYAEGRDLIVLAPVNPGAQLLADGHIHVYAPLRGRAVAGVRGSVHAQIFCQRLDAELVGIDAAYVAAEDLPPDLVGKPARIWLDGGICRFSRLPGP